MKTVKTIQQHGTEYTINQLGNCSYRIAYKSAGETRMRHVDKVWASVEDAEEYIATCKSIDAMMAMASGKYAPQKRYDAANTTQVKLKLNDTTDADILARLESVPNVQGYIKALIRADIDKKDQP